MNTDNSNPTGQHTRQSFEFLVTGGSVTCATVTLLAMDRNVARNMANALFPGSNLCEDERPCEPPLSWKPVVAPT